MERWYACAIALPPATPQPPALPAGPRSATMKRRYVSASAGASQFASVGPMSYEIRSMLPRSALGR